MPVKGKRRVRPSKVPAPDNAIAQFGTFGTAAVAVADHVSVFSDSVPVALPTTSTFVRQVAENVPDAVSPEICVTFQTNFVHVSVRLVSTATELQAPLSNWGVTVDGTVSDFSKRSVHPVLATEKSRAAASSLDCMGVSFRYFGTTSRPS